MNLKLKTLIEKVAPHNSLQISKLRSAKVVYDTNVKKFNIVFLEDFKQNSSYVNNNHSHNITVDRQIFIKSVIENITLNQWQHNDNPKKIVIDCSSPNIAKPFHMGHLRSTIIGNYVANINKYFCNNVTKINYLGDWGTQFGLLQYGLHLKNINVDEIKSNPIRILYDTYVEANKLATLDENVQTAARKYFADIEHGKTDLENWRNIRKVTVEELDKVYQRLGTTFDTYHWESDYNGGAINHIIKMLEQRNIIKIDESGKKIAKVNDRDITVMKSDNSTLYITRDIAALIDRYDKYKFDEMLYVVDNAQTDHFAAVFDIVNQVSEKYRIGCKHIKFGRIRGMSTRTGNVVFLNDILDEAKDKMYAKQFISKNTRSAAMNEQTCDVLGTTAVIINDLKQNRMKDYTFSWDRALQSEGDSGIKLQYLHCRLSSLEKNSGATLPTNCEPNYLNEEIIGLIVAELANFENVLSKSLSEYEACIIVNYLFRLSKLVNRMFNELRVKNVDPDVASQRLLIFNSSRLILNEALKILGVRPLCEM